MSNLILRKATEEDIPDMAIIMQSAFAQNAFDRLCFPPSDPATKGLLLKYIKSCIPDCTLAIDTETDTPLGWARWNRREAPLPTRAEALTADMFPPSGDSQLGMHFFETNGEHTAKNMNGESHWFLSTLVVRQEAWRKGVGAALMKVGAEGADRDGWIAGLNATLVGKALYERFGFKVIDITKFDHGIVSYHMKRDAKTLEAS